MWDEIRLGHAFADKHDQAAQVRFWIITFCWQATQLKLLDFKVLLHACRKYATNEVQEPPV